MENQNLPISPDNTPATPAPAANLPEPANSSPTNSTPASAPPTPPQAPVPPKSDTMKWALVGAGGLLLIGLLTVFLGGGGLFKGQLTLKESDTELTKLSTHLKPANTQVDPYQWPPQAGKATKFELLDNAPSDVVFWSKKDAGTWKVLQADFTSSVKDNIFTLNNKSSAKNTEISKIDLVIKNSNNTEIAKESFSGQTLKSVAGLPYTKTIPTAGTYTATLTASDKDGHSDSKTSEPFTIINTAALVETANNQVGALTSKVILSMPADQGNPIIQQDADLVNNVSFLKFQLKGSNKEEEISEIHLQISITPMAKLEHFKNIKLMKDGNILQNTAMTSSGDVIIKLDPPYPLAKETTKTFNLNVDFNSIGDEGKYKIAIKDIKFVDAKTVINAASFASASIEKTGSNPTDTASAPTIKLLACVNVLSASGGPFTYDLKGSATVTINGTDGNPNSNDWNWTWNFGDSSATDATPDTVTHVYAQTDQEQTITPTLSLTNKADATITKQVNCTPITIPAKAPVGVLKAGFTCELQPETDPNAYTIRFIDQSKIAETFISTGSVSMVDDHNSNQIFNAIEPPALPTQNYQIPKADIEHNVTYTANSETQTDTETTTIPTKCPALGITVTPPETTDIILQDPLTTYAEKSMASVLDAAVAFATEPETSLADFDWTFAHAGATVYFEAACTGGESLIHMSSYDANANSPTPQTVFDDAQTESDLGQAIWEQIYFASNGTYANLINLDIDSDEKFCATKEEAKVCKNTDAVKDLQKLATEVSKGKGIAEYFRQEPAFKKIIQFKKDIPDLAKTIKDFIKKIKDFIEKYEKVITSDKFAAAGKFIDLEPITAEDFEKIKSGLMKGEELIDTMSKEIDKELSDEAIQGSITKNFLLALNFNNNALDKDECKTALGKLSLEFDKEKNTLTLDNKGIPEVCIRGKQDEPFTIQVSENKSCFWLPASDSITKTPLGDIGMVDYVKTIIKTASDLLDKVGTHLDKLETTNSCEFAGSTFKFIETTINENFKDSKFLPVYTQTINTTQGAEIEIPKPYSNDKNITGSKVEKQPAHGEISEKDGKIFYKSAGDFTGVDGVSHVLNIDPKAKYYLGKNEIVNQLMPLIKGSGDDGEVDDEEASDEEDSADGIIPIPKPEGIILTCINVKAAEATPPPAGNGGGGGGGGGSGGGAVILLNNNNNGGGTVIPRAKKAPDVKTGTVNTDDFFNLKSKACLDRDKAIAFDDKNDATLKLLSSAVYDGKRLVEGYLQEDGSRLFNFDNPINRAELYKLIAFISCTPVDLPITASESFQDVFPEDWHYEIVNSGKQLKIINGYEDGKYFKPTRYTSRAEAAKLIMSVTKIDKAPESCTKRAVDVKKGSWFYEPSHDILCSNLLAGTVKDGEIYLRPSDDITRGEAALFIYNLAVHELEKSQAKK